MAEPVDQNHDEVQPSSPSSVEMTDQLPYRKPPRKNAKRYPLENLRDGYPPDEEQTSSSIGKRALGTDLGEKKGPDQFQPGYRYQLLKELAEGKKTIKQLGIEYGTSNQAISWFRKKNMPEIKAIAAKMVEKDNPFAGLWIVNKSNRLAQYQALLDDPTASAKTRQMALRHVAEELGDIPRAVTVHGEQEISYTLTIEGAGLDQSALS